MMRKLCTCLLAAILGLVFAACTPSPASTGASSANGTSSATREGGGAVPKPGAGHSGSSSVEGAGEMENRPYAEWVGVWESENGTMVIRFSHMADFVLDCYYYYPEDGFGFQINISEDEVDGNYIHSRMIDPTFDYHAEYELTLAGGGNSFSFVYHYQYESELKIIEECVFTKTDETDIEGAWKHFWDL